MGLSYLTAYLVIFSALRMSRWCWCLPGGAASASLKGTTGLSLCPEIAGLTGSPLIECPFALPCTDLSSPFLGSTARRVAPSRALLSYEPQHWGISSSEALRSMVSRHPACVSSLAEWECFAYLLIFLSASAAFWRQRPVLLTILPPVPRIQGMRAKLPQPCPTLCDPMDCSLPDSSVHGISHARILDTGSPQQKFPELRPPVHPAH